MANRHNLPDLLNSGFIQLNGSLTLAYAKKKKKTTNSHLCQHSYSFVSHANVGIQFLSSSVLHRYIVLIDQSSVQVKHDWNFSILCQIKLDCTAYQVPTVSHSVCKEISTGYCSKLRKSYVYNVYRHSYMRARETQGQFDTTKS